MENKTILLVDDERNIVILLQDFMERDGYTVLTAGDGREALTLFHERKDEIDLILLDVMMPHLDGWTVLREIRRVSQVPVFMLTARGEDFDEVHGFEIGATDYVKKPVSPLALMARVSAHFRRSGQQQDQDRMISVQGIEIDQQAHVVTLDGSEIPLSPKEYSLLVLLAGNKNRVISREQLLNQVWGYDYYGGLRTVDTHINRLRVKLLDRGRLIATVRGFGYRFEEE